MGKRIENGYFVREAGKRTYIYKLVKIDDNTSLPVHFDNGTLDPSKYIRVGKDHLMSAQFIYNLYSAIGLQKYTYSIPGDIYDSFCDRHDAIPQAVWVSTGNAGFGCMYYAENALEILSNLVESSNSERIEAEPFTYTGIDLCGE